MELVCCENFSHEGDSFRSRGRDIFFVAQRVKRWIVGFRRRGRRSVVWDFAAVAETEAEIEEVLVKEALSLIITTSGILGFRFFLAGEGRLSVEG